MSQQEPDGEDGFAANVVREAVQRVLIHQATPFSDSIAKVSAEKPNSARTKQQQLPRNRKSLWTLFDSRTTKFFVSHFVFQFHVFISVSFNFFRLPSVFLVQD